MRLQRNFLASLYHETVKCEMVKRILDFLIHEHYFNLSFRKTEERKKEEKTTYYMIYTHLERNYTSQRTF